MEQDNDSNASSELNEAQIKIANEMENVIDLEDSDFHDSK